MAETTTENERDVQAVQEAVAAWWAAVNAGDAERLIALSSQRLEMISPNEEPVTGEAAREVLREFFREFTVELFPFVDEEIAVSGDLAYQRHTYRWQLTPKAGGEPLSSEVTASTFSSARATAHGGCSRMSTTSSQRRRVTVGLTSQLRWWTSGHRTSGSSRRPRRRIDLSGGFAAAHPPDVRRMPCHPLTPGRLPWA
jgi:ketosteroid isomerase-like protein